MAIDNFSMWHWMLTLLDMSELLMGMTTEPKVRIDDDF
jgi:hypothetical protein